jgi:hypothetical protein
MTLKMLYIDNRIKVPSQASQCLQRLVLASGISCIFDVVRCEKQAEALIKMTKYSMVFIFLGKGSLNWKGVRKFGNINVPVVGIGETITEYIAAATLEGKMQDFLLFPFNNEEFSKIIGSWMSNIRPTTYMHKKPTEDNFSNQPIHGFSYVPPEGMEVCNSCVIAENTMMLRT